MKVNINILQENPLNQQIYGDDDPQQFNALVEKIRSSGWIKAILVNKEYVIIGGHRRVKAAKVLGIEAIEYELVDDNPEKQLEILLNDNEYRQKSTVQLIAEAEHYHEIESKKAHERQVAGVDLAVLKPQGSTNEIVAEKIGLSESSYAKARKVYQRMMNEEDTGTKHILGETLNVNIDAAAKLSEKPYAFIKEVGDKTFVDFKNVGKVIRELEGEEILQKTSLPPGKYQVIYGDLSNNTSESLSKLPIADIGEEDAVLMLWTTPKLLEHALNLINHWGFHYKTCLIWYKDVFEVSDNAEILTLSIKGNPPMIKQTEAAAGKTEKLELVRQMIDACYTGTKVELTFGYSEIEGWALWK